MILSPFAPLMCRVSPQPAGRPSRAGDPRGCAPPQEEAEAASPRRFSLPFAHKRPEFARIPPSETSFSASLCAKVDSA